MSLGGGHSEVVFFRGHRAPQSCAVASFNVHFEASQSCAEEAIAQKVLMFRLRHVLPLSRVK